MVDYALQSSDGQTALTAYKVHKRRGYRTSSAPNYSERYLRRSGRTIRFSRLSEVSQQQRRTRQCLPLLLQQLESPYGKDRQGFQQFSELCGATRSEWQDTAARRLSDGLERPTGSWTRFPYCPRSKGFATVPVATLQSAEKRMPNQNRTVGPRGKAVPIPQTDAGKANRSRLIEAFQHLPRLADVIRKAAASDSFRVVMSAENASLFKQGADGYWKPYLHNGGKFVENVNLEKISPDYAGMVSNIVMSVNMAAIAADLAAIKEDVRDIAVLIGSSARGEVEGAVGAVHQAKALQSPVERRHHTLDSCRTLSVSLGKLVGQLKAHSEAMPKPMSSWLEGFTGSGIGTAEAKWGEVYKDLQCLKDGLVVLLEAYGELGEGQAAKTALKTIIGGLQQANLPEVAKRARLVRVQPGMLAPEVLIKRFGEAVGRLTDIVLSSPMNLPSIAMDISQSEMPECP